VVGSWIHWAAHQRHRRRPSTAENWGRGICFTWVNGFIPNLQHCPRQSTARSGSRLKSACKGARRTADPEIWERLDSETHPKKTKKNKRKKNNRTHPDQVDCPSSLLLLNFFFFKSDQTKLFSRHELWGLERCFFFSFFFGLAFAYKSLLKEDSRREERRQCEYAPETILKFAYENLVLNECSI
jgi:hypothetical protein